MCVRVDDEGWAVAEAADAAGISERRAYEWLRRWREGDRVLEDRSSTPRRIPNRTPARIEAVIERCVGCG
jgi:transposase-like protein